MLYRDPKCVFVANNFGQADVVAGYLGEHGIPAEVMNQATHGGLVTPLLTGAVGIEVWVVDPAHAPEAVQLLGDHAMEQLTKGRTGPPVEAVCEECGASSTFPSKERGTVQSCPHCSAYLDVEDSYSDDDSVSEDEGDEPPRNDGITDGNSWGLTKP